MPRPTMSEAEKREEAIFHEALQYQNPEWRSAYLDRACGDDRELRLQVLSLLAAHEQAGEFLERFSPPEKATAPKPETADPKAPKPNAGGTVVLAAGTEKPGDRIGRYKLLQKIGEGGCGAVYMAEQEEPVRRRVALKIIKLGMDSKSVIARFEVERQALAMMDHPNIAKVLDAGAAETGRPFFVMELVRGIKVTDYCDQNNLSTRERLELFVKICQAIQHAHQKGLIHRDIKPSNILVTLHDGVPVPKVIDFGIAKATEQRLTDKTLFTEFKAFIGTPAYMSPEQAEMSGLDIDTRSDIYGLGVLLYELLTGMTPFDPEELLRAGLDEMRRTLREKEPVRPSTRLSTMLAAELTITARHRQAEAPKLISLIRGDLDWIVMKCLEKDRTRRYDTANGLAHDILRHLHHEPVIARPPSRLYRFQKLVRRNKMAFAAASAVVVALAAGFGVSTYLFLLKTRAYHRAVSAESEEARLRQEAEINERAARRIAYASDLNLAQEALRVNNIGRAIALLDRQRPAVKSEIRNPQSEVDLRGWEWRYLWQFCQSEALFTLCQRPATVSTLAVSADGRWVAVGEFGGALSVWDLRSRRELARLPATGTPSKVAFAPQQPWLAFVATDTNRQASVHLWDAVRQQVVARLPQPGLVRDLAFSADGATLVTWTLGEQGELTFWRVADGTRLRSFPAPYQPGHIGTGPLLGAAADLSVVAHVTAENRVRVVNGMTGEELWSAPVSEEILQTVALSPDGRLLATGSGFTESAIRLWEVASGKAIGQLEGHRSWVSGLVFWPDGKTLASASADQTIRLWDVATRQPAGTLNGHQSEVWAIALLSDNATLVSGAKDGAVYVWDTAGVRQRRAYVTVPVAVAQWRFSPDSQSIVTLDDAGRIDEWQGSEFRDRRALSELGTHNTGFASSPDGRFLVTGQTNGTVQVWNRLQQAITARFAASTGPVVPLCWRAGQGPLLTFDSEGVVREWDVAHWQETRSWRSKDAFRAADISTSGHLMVWLDQAQGVTARDLQTGRETRGRLDHSRIADLAVSPDGRLLVTGSEEGTVKMWRMDTFREVGLLRGHLLGVHSVAFSPDGKRIATGSNGREAVKLWDTESGQEVLTLEGSSSIFRMTAFSPDGAWLGSVNWTGRLHLWRAPSWAEIGVAEESSAEFP